MAAERTKLGRAAALAAAALLACPLACRLSAARALEYEGSAHGIPAPAYPSPAAIAAAARFLQARAGSTAFAVVDSEGRVQGLRPASTSRPRAS